MEYFIGSAVTILLLTGLLYAVRRIPQERIRIAQTSQSRMFELVGRYLVEKTTPFKLSQSIKHQQSTMIKVFVMKNKAYWIKDNKVFTADIVNDEINSDDGVEVDMMSMTPVQLKEMLFIIDQLKEHNDNWNTGKS